MSIENQRRPDVVVVGAGVVGLSAALAAQARGLAVTVLGREGPAAGAGPPLDLAPFSPQRF